MCKYSFFEIKTTNQNVFFFLYRRNLIERFETEKNQPSFAARKIKAHNEKFVGEVAVTGVIGNGLIVEGVVGWRDGAG